jgi:hypothetical protein
MHGTYKASWTFWCDPIEDTSTKSIEKPFEVDLDKTQ